MIQQPKYLVQLFTVADWTFALLPSEKRRFREAVNAFAQPFEHTNLTDPAYRFPNDCLIAFLDLVIKHYGRSWVIKEWYVPPGEWSRIPPWGRSEAQYFLPRVMDDPPTWENMGSWQG